MVPQFSDALQGGPYPTTDKVSTFSLKGGSYEKAA